MLCCRCVRGQQMPVENHVDNHSPMIVDNNNGHGFSPEPYPKATAEWYSIPDFKPEYVADHNNNHPYTHGQINRNLGWEPTPYQNLNRWNDSRDFYASRAQFTGNKNGAYSPFQRSRDHHSYSVINEPGIGHLSQNHFHISHTPFESNKSGTHPPQFMQSSNQALNHITNKTVSVKNPITPKNYINSRSNLAQPRYEINNNYEAAYSSRPWPGREQTTFQTRDFRRYSISPTTSERSDSSLVTSEDAGTEFGRLYIDSGDVTDSDNAYAIECINDINNRKQCTSSSKASSEPDKDGTGDGERRSRRKASHPRRSATRGDPKFKGVTFQVRIAVHQDKAQLAITAYFK